MVFVTFVRATFFVGYGFITIFSLRNEPARTWLQLHLGVKNKHLPMYSRPFIGAPFKNQYLNPNMEAWKMIFLLNWLNFMFQPFIFKGRGPSCTMAHEIIPMNDCVVSDPPT